MRAVQFQVRPTDGFPLNIKKSNLLLFIFFVGCIGKLRVGEYILEGHPVAVFWGSACCTQPFFVGRASEKGQEK